MPQPQRSLITSDNYSNLNPTRLLSLNSDGLVTNKGSKGVSLFVNGSVLVAPFLAVMMPAVLRDLNGHRFVVHCWLIIGARSLAACRASLLASCVKQVSGFSTFPAFSYLELT